MAELTYHRPAILKQIRHDRHCVIEASAGTGKTHAIEYLVLELLLNTDCSIEEILVVTFTEKATAELRARIRALFEGVLSGSRSWRESVAGERVALDDAGRSRLETALFAFDRAPICTIHAFCRRILTDLAFDTGAAFGLEVVDAHRAFHRAFRSELREVLAVDEHTRALLDEWMTEGETVRHPNLVDSLEALLREAHFSRYLQSGAAEQSRHSVDRLMEIFDPALLRKLRSKGSKSALAADPAVDELTAALRTGSRASNPSLRAALSAFKPESLAKIREKNHDPKALNLIDAMMAACAACALDARVVDTFLPLVEDRMRKEKRQNNEIDYGDMLENVREALDGDRGPVLTALLRQRFRRGLVDEFQDTDDLQWKIFRRIFLESEARNILYIVGDPKQAIYSFRGADVFTYLDAREEIRKSGGTLVKLVDNYRSTGVLIEALNHVLDQRAAKPLFSGAIDYDTPVRCARPDLRARRRDGSPVIPITMLKYGPSGGHAGVARMRASLGRHIASEIRGILFDPDSTITIADGSQSRRVEASDIYILTRTGAEAAEIGGYLREQGVPFAFYKKDGLFQTSEAYDVLDVLSAIEEPQSQSKRLKAWVSPFFAVPYPDLFDRDEIAAGQQLQERLYEWKSLAEQERFGALFDQLIHRSGLVGRELFLSNSERELTNYLHIFEILLEQILTEKLSLNETINRLESYIGETALPAGIESNIQRIESERSAVQIMTVHMSKGLQAAVVFLFGGTVRSNILPRVWAYHDAQHQRRNTIGKAGRALVSTMLEDEARDENQRLIYVAITRARAKLYLPLYPDGSTRRAVNGYYQALNDRLKTFSDEIDSPQVRADLFEQVNVGDVPPEAEQAGPALERRIATWTAPASLAELLKDSRPARWFEDLRARSRPMQTRSYTSLEARAARQNAGDLEVEEFKYDLDAPSESADLRGGRRVGIFLHEVIEKIGLESFATVRDAGSWRERDDVRQVFLEAMRRHQVNDPRWFERGTEIVFNALTSRVATATGKTVGPLFRCQSVREMEFVYPIPERPHPLLDSANHGEWAVERGYLKGFVDFVFEDAGLHYFADWKSDSLPAYDRASIEPHVMEHYNLQARIYSVGIVRLLGIRSKADYDARFGGLLYLFLRGMKRDGAGDDGVYFHRPDWTEIGIYERELLRAVPEIVAAS